MVVCKFDIFVVKFLTYPALLQICFFLAPVSPRSSSTSAVVIEEKDSSVRGLLNDCVDIRSLETLARLHIMCAKMQEDFSTNSQDHALTAAYCIQKLWQVISFFRGPVYAITFSLHTGLVSYRICLLFTRNRFHFIPDWFHVGFAFCLHETVFTSYRIGFISDLPSVYTKPFSLHTGLVSYRICLLFARNRFHFIPDWFHIGFAFCLHETVFTSYRIGFISDLPSVYTKPFSFHTGLVSYRICLLFTRNRFYFIPDWFHIGFAFCLHETVFTSYRSGFISDLPSVYTNPFSFHIELASCLHENAPIRSQEAQAVNLTEQ